MSRYIQWSGIAFLLVAVLLGACSSDPTWDKRDGLNPGVVFAPNTPRPIPIPRDKPQVPGGRAGNYAAVPASGAVTVRRGDTVYGISRRYGVPIEEVIAANSLRPPYILQVGQQLRMPAARTHIVERGDTGYSIARRYGVDVSDLMRVNDIGPPYTLRIGQVLRLPARVRTPDPGYTPATATSSRPGTASGTPRSRRIEDLPPPPPRIGRTFSWPAVGRVISTFGPKGGGLHNDGINIELPPSSPVRAAESGVVAYVGDELRGFGNLLLIKHSDGWVTAYAHNESILVQRGQQVQRGQIVSRAGSTGGVATSQLHFEIRKGSTPVNPEHYLES